MDARIDFSCRNAIIRHCTDFAGKTNRTVFRGNFKRNYFSFSKLFLWNENMILSLKEERTLFFVYNFIMTSDKNGLHKNYSSSQLSTYLQKVRYRYFWKLFLKALLNEILRIGVSLWKIRTSECEKWSSIIQPLRFVG